MTLAIGVTPGDGSGAVLLTDSLVQLRRGQGAVHALLHLTPRYERLPGAGGVAIVSCMADAGWAPCSTAVGIEAAGRELLVDLERNLAREAWQFADGRTVEARGEIVAAGLDDAGNVQLVHGLTGGELHVASGPTLVVGGAARELPSARRFPAPPSDMTRCVRFALGVARAILAEVAANGTLDEMLQRGEVPAMAPPIHLAVVTRDRVEFTRLQE